MDQTRTQTDDFHDARVGAALNAFLEARRRGEPITESECLRQHPDLADELRLHFAMLRDLPSARSPIEQLLARGQLAPSDEPEYAASLGQYRIEELLGRGGMGVVLKAFDPALRRHVALKLLRSELADDRVALLRFLREARAAAKLNCPQIVRVFAIGQETGTPYLSMEYVNGPTLAQYIRERGPLPAEACRRVARDLLQALKAAHDAALVHRDVKSSNVLLELTAGSDGGSPSGEPAIAKLADFGLARATWTRTPVTAPDSVLGTPEYMSPEPARGDAEIDRRSDLFSAGIVIYEMLTGQAPFRADRPSSVVYRIIHDAPAIPRLLREGVDARLESLALALLAKAPADRPQTADDALGILDGAAAPRRTQVRPRARLAIAAAALLVLLGVLTAISAWRSRAARIVAVRADSDPTRPGFIECLQQGSAQWRRFPLLGALSTERAREPSLGECFDGRQLVVSSFENAAGTRTFAAAVDALGRQVWRISADPKLSFPVPDCASSERWAIDPQFAARLPAGRGDDVLLLVRGLDSFLSCLSRRRLEDGAELARFWHQGILSGARLCPDYFEKDRPAVVAWGINNKLDGYGDPVPPDHEGPRYTIYPKVACVMILDPLEMEGLGPPATSQIPVSAAALVEYAFLDLPSDTTAYWDRGVMVRPARHETLFIGDVAVQPDGERGALLSLRLMRHGETLPKAESCGELLADARLNIVGSLVGDEAKAQCDPQVIIGRFQRLISEGHSILQPLPRE